ncbi:MAG: GTP-binding protein [Betaproteobacteria bacterium]|nr:GTP-binding protein [Betaproteobacteria bacterium]
MNAQTSLVPVILLTGFLGSGKTTMLRSLLAYPDMSGSAVIINEFGEIGIDHLLVDSPVLEPVLLPNGCLCCTSRGQLSTSLQELADKDAFKDIQRVFVETTGLADPIPLLQGLATDLPVSERFRLGGVVTTVDCINGAATLATYEEAVCQVAIADRLLITKTDLASPEVQTELKRRVSSINPGTQAIEIISGAIEPRDIAGLSLHDAITTGVDVGRWVGVDAPLSRQHHVHGRRIGTFHIVRDRPLPWAAFVNWMETLANVRGEDLLRVKGILNIAEWPDEPVVIHGVQHVFHPPVRLRAWPDKDRRTRIVFITRGLGRETIETTLHLLDGYRSAASCM